MSRRVLLVDDEPDLRFAVRLMLRRGGFDVSEAGDGIEALDRWREASEPFDAIILDQRMPRMTGLEAAVALREAGYGGALLLFSGYLDGEAKDAADELGIPTMAKVDVEGLVDAVDTLIHGPAKP